MVDLTIPLFEKMAARIRGLEVGPKKSHHKCTMLSYSLSGAARQHALSCITPLLLTLLMASGCGSSQDVTGEVEQPERGPFLVAKVLFPNGEPAEKATVQTEPFTTTVQADTQGVSHIHAELISGDYQLVALHARYPDERGQTAIAIGQEAPSDSVYIVMGRSMIHPVIDMDTESSDSGTCCFPTGCIW